MALTNCSNCGQSVSDKAKVCPHCGFGLSEKPYINPILKKCEDCGVEFDISLPACPQCGCPSESRPAFYAKKKDTRRLVTLIAVAALILVCVIFTNQKAEATKYYDAMESVSYLMINSAADAEKAGNLINSVWFNAIYKKSDSETDKYTIVNGRFVDDFNDALSNLFSDDGFVATISKIQNTQNNVTSLMKQLKNPPKEFVEAYDVLKSYYESYLNMTKMVISPVGSLQSFSEDFNDIDTETVNNFEKMKLYLD